MTQTMPSQAGNRLERSPSGTANGRDRDEAARPERFGTIVIGGGQAGLATGYHLARLGLDFVILEAHERVGESWRRRWDSLRLLAPARYSGLPGMPFPAPAYSFPTKDEMADYLQTYVNQVQLPVRTGVAVERVSRLGESYLVETSQRRYLASQVVIATGAFHTPNVPPFATELDPSIQQLYANTYRNPNQLQKGPVLVVGAGNSGAEIAYEAARDHRTWLSGRHPGTVPFDTDSRLAHLLVPVMWFTFNHVLTVRTPLGRKAGPHFRAHGTPVERIRPVDLAEAGVERVYERTVGTRDGLPLLADGRVLEVTNIVWCTGFRPDFSWIDLPVTDDDGWPRQQRGVVPEAPGLYFVGLPFLYSLASPLIGGVGRDADFIARHIAVPSRAGSLAASSA